MGAAPAAVRVRLNRGEADGETEAALSVLSAAVIAAQDGESGLWWSVINRPGEVYLETSAAALFAFGLARSWRYGFAGDEVLGPVALAVAGVEVGDAVAFDSPSAGLVEVGWEGPALVEGVAIDKGPYARWDNGYVQQEYGHPQVLVTCCCARLELDFAAMPRRLVNICVDNQ